MTEADFMKKAKMQKNAYGWHFALRIYRTLLTGVVNVQEEYRKYYRMEYNGLGEFLYKKYNMESDFIKKLFKQIDGKTLYYRPTHENGDWSIEQFIASAEGMGLINKIMTGKKHED